MDEHVTTLPVGVGLMGLSSGILGAVYVPPLAAVKPDLFIVRAACSMSVFMARNAIAFSFIASWNCCRNL